MTELGVALLRAQPTTVSSSSEATIDGRVSASLSAASINVSTT